jgi:uncharacterized protein involved in response to NO
MTPSALATRSPPAILSLGLRPFFLVGAIHAAVVVLLWAPWFLGFVSIPSALPPLAWHTHELLFGFVPAIVAGFLLTAVPSWTGRAPLRGAPLAGLLALWLVGRAAVSTGAEAPALLVAAASLAFTAALAGFIGHEIVRAENRRNLKVVGVLVGLLAAQALFHYEVARYGAPVLGDRLALALVILLVTIIAGRIVPAFTGNWIRRSNPGREPAPFGALDRAAMLVGGVALAGWAALPEMPALAAPVGGLLIMAGLAHLARQARWVPHRTLREPLVAILHLGYLFVPVGFLLAGAAALEGVPGAAVGATHAWAVGAIGVMTLAVMTRASRGHTGRALAADTSTILIYLAIVAAAAMRIAAAMAPQHTMLLVPASAVLWSLAYVGFAAVYGPMLWRPRADAAQSP